MCSSGFSTPVGGARHGIRHGRRHHRQGSPPRTGRKRGTPSQAIGKSKGGRTTKILALTDALGNLVRFVLLPGQRFDTVGVAPLIDGVISGADRRQGLRQRLDHRRTERARRQIVIPASTTKRASRHRQRDVQRAPPDRKLLRQTQGVQAHRHARRQDRSKLHGHDPSRRSRHKLAMNLNRP